jgi:hypothetical protein
MACRRSVARVDTQLGFAGQGTSWLQARLAAESVITSGSAAWCGPGLKHEGKARRFDVEPDLRAALLRRRCASTGENAYEENCGPKKTEHRWPPLRRRRA